MVERRGNIPAERSNPSAWYGEEGWDPTSWYGDENVLPEWAKEYIRNMREPLGDEAQQEKEKTGIPAEDTSTNSH